MTKLIIEDDQGRTHVLHDANVTIEWETDHDPLDIETRWLARPLFTRPISGTTRVSASTRSPMTSFPTGSESERLEALGFGEDMKLVRRGTPIDPEDTRKGDRIRVEWTYDDGSVLSREETASRNGYGYVGSAEQRSIYLLERAPFTLPTVVGSVVRVETEVDTEPKDYTLGLDRRWRNGDGDSFAHVDFENHFDGEPSIEVES